jgi:hypothetical protein
MDPVARLPWFERELGPANVDNRRWLRSTATFWTTLLSSPMRRVIWFSRRSAVEHAGFLECLWRLEDTPYDVVDATDLTPPQKAPDFGLCVLNPDYLRSTGLFARAAALPPALRVEYRERWRHLRAENAPFRIVRDLKLVSAPMTIYDGLVLACASSEWQRTGIVIAKAMTKSEDQVGDLVLFGRLRYLVKTGALEARGNLALMGTSDVRLPVSREAGEAGAGQARAG